MPATEVFDPELSDLADKISNLGIMPEAEEFIRGIELGIIWSHLWNERGDLEGHQCPVHRDNTAYCHDIANLIGWQFHVEVLPEGWDHEGDLDWNLGVFTKPGE